MKQQKVKQFNSQTIKRLFGYITGAHRLRLIVVFFCILISAGVNVASSLFIKTLIDNYIDPLLLQDNPVFDGLLYTLLIMAGLYIAGIISTFCYNRLMVSVSQGVLKTIRDNMFAHMQTLPIPYFDTHTHGDVMSYYTNDTDTLRQMISQSLPQLISSCVSILTVFCSMVYLSLPLTILVLICVAVMLFVVSKIGGKSASYFMKQQLSLASVNGYIEEMINGQKVVKVFCHEEASEADFDRLSDSLADTAAQANTYANILMPIMSNIGNLQYVLIAIIGGALAIGGVGGMTLGSISSFLMLSRSFNGPISQIAQQINSVAMALAGAERIFKFLDEKPESDNGKVTLVNATNENGVIRESDKRTGQFAWKVPQPDNSVQYVPLRGDVRLFNTRSSVEPDKLILHDVSLYAKPGQKIAFVGATGAAKLL